MLRTPSTSRILGGILLLTLPWGIPLPGVGAAAGAAQTPPGQVHLSLTLGGYAFLGVGYTHWVEEHHALEVTIFPLTFPRAGRLFVLRGGYAWAPSNERWRAKLGGNLTLLVDPARSPGPRVEPLLTFTPGIFFDSGEGRFVRGELWMSYYVTQKVFAPAGLELLYGWKG